MSQADREISLHSITWQSLKIGCLGFGGPTGQIALLHRIFVDEKKWVDEPRFLHALNFCMLLPGPEAQQLAVYLGWLMRGVRGGLIAGTLFVVPGMAFMLAISWVYAAHGDLPVIALLFYGVKAAVLAIVADALFRIGRRALKGPFDAMIAAAAFAALLLFGIPFPLVILVAASLSAVLALRNLPGDRAAIVLRSSGAQSHGTLATILIWIVLWLCPLGIVWIALGEGHLLTQVGILFSQLSLVTFGGAYAVLAYLQQMAVEAYGWLTAAQMVDGLGLAETTPGPLVLVNQFVGFQAGWNQGSGWLALAAALMASWNTFIPSFLWIFAGAPFAERLRTNPFAAAALKGVTAAVLGVVLSLAVWFSMHVLFDSVRAVSTPWGHVIQLPVLEGFDPFATLIAVAAGIAIIRFKLNIIAAIALCGVAALLRPLLV